MEGRPICAYIRSNATARSASATSTNSLIVLGRGHRNRPTQAEALLWSRLRRRQLDGFQFRRQFPVGHYFADFFCVKVRLAIEVDGPSHAERQRRDRFRDSFFHRRGIAVLRFSNQQVLEETHAVLELIRAALDACSPLTTGGGRGGEN